MEEYFSREREDGLTAAFLSVGEAGTDRNSGNRADELFALLAANPLDGDTSLGSSLACILRKGSR
jgi:hypothetical protein